MTDDRRQLLGPLYFYSTWLLFSPIFIGRLKCSSPLFCVVSLGSNSFSSLIFHPIHSPTCRRVFILGVQAFFSLVVTNFFFFPCHLVLVYLLLFFLADAVY